MQWKAPSRLDDPGMMDIPDEEHLQARLHPVSQTCFRGSLLVSRFAYALKSRTQSLWLRYSDANQIADSLCSCQSGRYDVNRHLNANEARGQVLRVQRFGRRFSEKGRNFQAAFSKARCHRSSGSGVLVWMPYDAFRIKPNRQLGLKATPTPKQGSLQVEFRLIGL